MEIWRIISSGFVPGSLVFGVWVLLAEYEKLDLLGDDFSYVRNAWFNCEYMFCISTHAFGEFHIFSTAERTRILRCSSSFSRTMEKSAQSMPRVP